MLWLPDKTTLVGYILSESKSTADFRESNISQKTTAIQNDDTTPKNTIFATTSHEKPYQTSKILRR